MTQFEAANALGQVGMSQSLRASLQRAVAQAFEQSHRQVTLEHLLLSLTEDRDAAVILEASSVDLTSLLTSVSSYLGQLDDRVPQDTRIEPQLGGDVQHIVQSAGAAAQKSGRTSVGSALVLAAIVGDGRSIAAKMLRDHGLSFENAIQALKQANVADSARQVQPAPASPNLQGAVGAVDGASGPGQERLQNVQAAHDIIANARERIAAARGVIAARSVPDEKVVQPITAQERPPESSDQVPSVAAQIMPTVDASRNANSVAMSAEGQPGRDVPPRPLQGAPVAAPAERSDTRDLPTDFASPAVRSADQSVDDDRDAARTAAQAVAQAAALSRPSAAKPPRWHQPPQVTRPVSELAGGMRGPPPPSGDPAMPPPPPPPTNRSAPPVPPQGMPQPYRPVPSPPAVHPPPPPFPNSHQPAQADLSTGRPGISAENAKPIEPETLAAFIPTRMCVGVPMTIEIRAPRVRLEAWSGGASQGHGGMHDQIITKAMMMRLRAPEGGFRIETASPETQWSEGRVGPLADDVVSWRWIVTPVARGRKTLALQVATRVVARDGLAAARALPQQDVEVRVAANFGRLARQVALCLVIAGIGVAIGFYGEHLFSMGSNMLAQIMQ